MRARVVLLDALGTLVKLEPPAPRLRIELRERLGLAVSEEQARGAIRAEIAYYRAHLDEGRDERRLSALRRRCAEVLWRELPVGDEPPEIEALVGALLASLRFTPFPEVTGVLRQLGRRGLARVVVSNWDVSLPGVLAELGIARHLDGVVTSARSGVRKPDPSIFAHALALAGDVRPEDALHVGDSLTEDVAGARAAGIPAVLIARDGIPPSEAVQTISTLEELLGLLSP